jgi:hypothetical protein
VYTPARVAGATIMEVGTETSLLSPEAVQSSMRQQARCVNGARERRSCIIGALPDNQQRLCLIHMSGMNGASRTLGARILGGQTKGYSSAVQKTGSNVFGDERSLLPEVCMRRRVWRRSSTSRTGLWVAVLSVFSLILVCRLSLSSHHARRFPTMTILSIAASKQSLQYACWSSISLIHVFGPDSTLFRGGYCVV